MPKSSSTFFLALRTARLIGFITPKLYALKPSANALRDITDGDNGVNEVTGYKARAGRGACTRLGSLHGVNLRAAL
jgi:hypothetical protein